MIGCQQSSVVVDRPALGLQAGKRSLRRRRPSGVASVSATIQVKLVREEWRRNTVQRDQNVLDGLGTQCATSEGATQGEAVTPGGDGVKQSSRNGLKTAAAIPRIGKRHIRGLVSR